MRSASACSHAPASSRDRSGARLDVRAIGDGYFWVVETDDSDVPYLVRYRYDVTSRDR
ncbi:MAG TPA: hypothetical protein VF178_03615 [Gemmatimonadaceae bacterium]